MSGEDTFSGSDLLNQFELILESDPLIDEVGFIHPSQFELLNSEAGSSFSETHIGDSKEENPKFWIRDHKLGISTHLLFQLYMAAKDAFTGALAQYRTLEGRYNASSSSLDTLESEVMKHSKSILLLSCDFGTAWNSRKLIVSKKQQLSVFIDELSLSALVLSYSPKSEQAWCHRRWVIKMVAEKCSTLEEIIGKESKLVQKIAERSKMNYRAWNHRCWLVTYMTREQVLDELKKSRDWARLHVTDNSCFHFRTRLLLRILEEFCHKQEDENVKNTLQTYQIWQEELDWVAVLIKLYAGREALWLHRRFLSFCWIRHFTTDVGDLPDCSQHKSNINTNIYMFLDNELALVTSCSTMPDNEFEDFQAQALHAATYILWLTKQIPKFRDIRIREKLSATNMKSLLVVTCPERSSLWESLALD
ncbi:hypothetical protein K2173_015214 [Erythroxylum novogranatense]|uniref:Uncharacterized protein n=1 Tax=Erythroxylum novogranatense TaxID=1862640 RepID=A0AAV8T1J9_9ROSI|nr:hypothetical protein K2173_015214 [Erythroxylum novogranatense]